MNPMNRVLVTAVALGAFAATAWGQNDTEAKPSPNNKPVAVPLAPAITAADFQALKEGLAAAQRQIQALQDDLRRRDLAAQQGASAAQQLPASQQHMPGVSESEVAGLEAVASPASNNPTMQNGATTPREQATGFGQETQQVFNPQMEGPLTIHFRGINVTPGGFAEAAFVRRSRALSADLPTPFNSLTMPGASQSHVPEFFGSARQSRPTVFVEGRAGNVDLSSYLSGDFLSAGVTSTSTQTNSYTFRLRQVWGQARFSNGWSFLGGQMWSLVTENKVGIAPSDDTGRSNDARPSVIDPSYHVGFTFARQYGIRVTKGFGQKVWFAISMENPEATLSTHGNVNNFLLGQLGNSKSYNSTATYSFNPAPDLIAKAAFDPGFGHYEIFGLLDRFTDRVFPCVEFPATAAQCTAAGATSATGAHSTSKEGGGFGVNARWNFADNHIVFGLHAFGGSGVGRYGSGQLPDLSIHADGTVHLIKDLQGLGTLEWHGKKLDIYAYGGAENASRAWGTDPLQNGGKGVPVGYGAPAFNNMGCSAETAPGTTTVGFTPGSLNHCTGDTRTLIEGTIGFWYRFYVGPRGRFQFGTQYSYVSRNSWSGAGGLPAGTAGLQPNGLDGMVFTSFRYYLP